MLRPGLVLISLVLSACNTNKSPLLTENGFSYEAFSKKFSNHSLPYQLADTSIIKNKDTAVIKSKTLSGFISDSLKSKVFGKNSKVRYTALAKFNKANAETYYLVKGVNGNRRAVLILVFDKNEQFTTSFPFLNSSELGVSQLSTIDKSFSVSINKVKKKANGSASISRNVYQYNNDKRKFLLILTDTPGEGNSDIINPIDSFPKKNKLSGDYVRNIRNFISIRDGRHANKLMVFVHLENENGCTGEFKGELLLASPNTAIYRHGGDPCVLSFKFSPPYVNIKEDEGCGSYRGIDCLFEGTFQKKSARAKSKKKRSYK